MPTPTIGAEVIFRLPHRAELYRAIITGINSDGTVNLSVSENGGAYPVLAVPLVHNEDDNLRAPPYATWPKAEAAPEEIEVPPKPIPRPAKAEKKPRRKAKKK